MAKFSDILNVEASKKEEHGCSPIVGYDYANASTLNLEQVAELRQCIRAISPIINEIKLEVAAMEAMSGSKEYKGILDILSHGDMEGFHSRLGISSNDLFNRSETGKRDIYISSLTKYMTGVQVSLVKVPKSVSARNRSSQLFKPSPPKVVRPLPVTSVTSMTGNSKFLKSSSFTILSKSF